MSDLLVQTQRVDLLEVEVWDDARALGAASARAIADALRGLLARQHLVRIVFAAAPSQHETLKALVREPGIDWERVDAFHMDEYVGIAPDAPQSFGNWLRSEIFGLVPFHSVNLFDPDGSGNPAAEAARYGSVVSASPVDIVLAGIGMNGHLAFNDPPADFETDVVAQLVDLDEESRIQQVEEGLFPGLAEVPTHAWTLTIPFLLSADQIFCMASGRLKRSAVRRVLTGDVVADVPASALRRHPNVRLFLDREAYEDE